MSQRKSKNATFIGDLLSRHRFSRRMNWVFESIEVPLWIFDRRFSAPKAHPPLAEIVDLLVVTLRNSPSSSANDR
jgi:hypothetical protein